MAARVPPDARPRDRAPAWTDAPSPTDDAPSRARARRDRANRIGWLFMVVGMFMAILDIQIVSSSLAEIQAGISAGADEASWVQTSYLIAEVIMIPFSGFLGRLLSTRVLFTLSAVGFTLTSVGCALVTSIEGMIVMRALQGFIGGAMIPTVFATTYAIFPEGRRAAMSVVMGLVATMAPTFGPILGGYLTFHYSWHWLFLINVVPGVLVAAGVWSLLDIDRGDRSLLRGFDLFGLLGMAVFLGGLEYVLEEGPRWDWFEDPTVAGAAAVTVAAAVLFFARMFAYDRPIVDLGAFRDRNFAIGCLYSFVLGVGLYGSVYLMPLFMSQVRGYNSLEIGLTMIVTGAFQCLSAPLAGALSKKLDLRVMLALGMALFGVGAYLNHFLTADSAFWELFVPQMVRGLALLFCFLPINQLALGTLPPDRLKNASGLYNLMRNLGGAVGLAAINTVITARAALHVDRLDDWVNAARPVVQDRIDGLTSRFEGVNVLGGDAELAAIRSIAATLEREALILSYNDAFLLMAAVFFAGLAFMPLVRKPKGDGGGEAH